SGSSFASFGSAGGMVAPVLPRQSGPGFHRCRSLALQAPAPRRERETLGCTWHKQLCLLVGGSPKANSTESLKRMIGFRC
ncbi:hypothetical protein ABTN61_20135, partial [Acinetobacter baumannii]